MGVDVDCIPSNMVLVIMLGGAVFGGLATAIIGLLNKWSKVDRSEEDE